MLEEVRHIETIDKDTCMPFRAAESVFPDSGNPKIIYYKRIWDSIGFDLRGGLLQNGFYHFLVLHTPQCFFYPDTPRAVGASWGKYASIDNLYSELGAIRQGSKHGWWITYHSYADTLVGTFKEYEYLQDSSWTYWAHSFTEYRHSLVEHYKNGFRHGKYTIYDVYFQKPLYETTFKHGTGYYKDFYPINGMPIQSEGQYVKGKKVGKWIYYTPLGKQTIVEYPK